MRQGWLEAGGMLVLGQHPLASLGRDCELILLHSPLLQPLQSTTPVQYYGLDWKASLTTTSFNLILAKLKTQSLSEIHLMKFYLEFEDRPTSLGHMACVV